MKPVPGRSPHLLALMCGAAALFLVILVSSRFGVFRLAVEVATPAGPMQMPSTFATVDHPFHVARASMLWNELAAGRTLRWVGQHQGGYPVEFYPLGEAWLEVAIRALSLNSLNAEGAHTLAVATIFLLPGVGFFAITRIGGGPAVVGLLALALHVALPGGWYDGGYTELVQWGLVTNVAGAVAAFLLLPALGRFLMTGSGVSCTLAAGLAAAAIYANPRSLVGVVAVGAGTWLAVTIILAKSRVMTAFRLTAVAVLAALLAAPELVSLTRFGHLYSFVRYSGYEDIGAYASRSINSVTGIVFGLGAGGAVVGLAGMRRSSNVRSHQGAAGPEAGTARFLIDTNIAIAMAACSLIGYALLTGIVAFVPSISALAPQLEPTRLMPMQRLLTIYLAASFVILALHWLFSRRVRTSRFWAGLVGIGLSMLIVAVLCFPALEAEPDPASPVIPSKGLYPVAMSAQQVQLDFRNAVREADAAAAPGTALLVIGSALSWHQPLWAPLWTKRPLYYDNWLWSWRPDHAGTPGYQFEAGNHYPDPERTLERTYLQRHGIGAVVITGRVQATAARLPWLTQHRGGQYSVFVVNDPVTTLSIGDRNGESPRTEQGMLFVNAVVPAESAVARVYWHPRWRASGVDAPATIDLRPDGYQEIKFDRPVSEMWLAYMVQPIDWIARIMATIGILGILGFALSPARRLFQGSPFHRWYARHPAPGMLPHRARD